VRSPCDVGETPRFQPGEAFKYQSFCPLPTPWGTMEGSYTFQRDDGTTFEVAIGRFYLRTPAREPAATA
jgi:ApaG protein